MKKLKIFYWIFTILLSAGLGIGAVFNAMSSPESVEILKHLGYPAYLVPFLGVAKLLGIIAILIPGFPRLKEWAYAGLTYDIIGAMYSHIAIGAPAKEWAPLFIIIFIIAGSYIFYHKIQSAKVESIIEGNMATVKS
jgi:hypothetical protein